MNYEDYVLLVYHIITVVLCQYLSNLHTPTLD